jgi:hypothetical protein
MMFDFLFGEGQYGLRFLFAFVVVLALIALTTWLVRRFGGDRLGAAAARVGHRRHALALAAASRACATGGSDPKTGSTPRARRARGLGARG